MRARSIRGVSQLILCLSVANLALCHVVWQYPTPRYDGDDKLKADPCGTGGQLNDWSAPLTTLRPGKQLLQFRETIIHTGAPCRIAMTLGTDDHYSQYVLLDHIPHNEGAPKVNGAVMHAVEVEIPPVDCSEQNCGLQLIQVMTDKFAAGATCANPSQLSASCGNRAFAYFSCANIKIEGGNVSDPAPIYRSWTVGTAEEREPYRPGQVGTWCFDSENEHWRLHGNGFSCPGMEEEEEEEEEQEEQEEQGEEEQGEEEDVEEEADTPEEEQEEQEEKEDTVVDNADRDAVGEDEVEGESDAAEEGQDNEEDAEEDEDTQGGAEYSADVEMSVRFPLSMQALAEQRGAVEEAVASVLGVSADRVTLSKLVEVPSAGSSNTGVMVDAVVEVAVVDESEGKAIVLLASSSSVEAALESIGIEGAALVGSPSVVPRGSETVGAADSESAGHARGGPSAEQAASLLITVAVSILVLTVV